jgi:hypothetical protein
MFISHSHLFGFFFFDLLPLGSNLKSTQKAYGVDVVSKTMTPLFFRVARAVGEQYHISKVFNNNANNK